MGDSNAGLASRITTFDVLDSLRSKGDDSAHHFIDEFMSIHECPIWIHEKRLFSLINVPFDRNTFGKHHSLMAVIYVIKKGVINSKKKGKFIVNSKYARHTFGNDPTAGGRLVTAQRFGSKEEFHSGDLHNPTKHQPHWFRFGPGNFDVGVQKLIVSSAIGDDGSLQEDVISRRREFIKSFVFGGSNDGGFSTLDVPVLAYQFKEELGLFSHVNETRIVDDGESVPRDAFVPEELVTFEKLLKLMVVASLPSFGGCLTQSKDAIVVHSSASGARANRASSVPSISSRLSTNRTPPPQDDSDDDNEPPQLLRRKSSLGAAIPDSLRYQSLTCISSDGHLIAEKVPSLALFELLFHLHKKESFSFATVQVKLNELGVDLPQGISIDDLRGMSQANISNAISNIGRCRSEFVSFSKTACLATPLENQLLFYWQKECHKFSQGVQFVACNMEPNKSGNGVLGLTLKAAWIIRHIVATLSIPISRILNYWACFYYLITHKPIDVSQLPGVSSIWNHTHRISLIDAEAETRQFQEFITRRSKYGFRYNFGMSSDKSKHGGRDRSAVYITSNRSDDPSVVDPTFRLMTVSVSAVKSSEFAARDNVDLFVKVLGLKFLGYFGGASEVPAIRQLAFENGVLRRVITNGDPYHIANLTVTGASIKAFGDTAKDDLRQVHHRRCMQSLHDLHMGTREIAQGLLDQVTEGSTPFKLYTVRERIQRWLVNQRYAAKILWMLEFKTTEEDYALIEFLVLCANQLSGYLQTVALELVLWLQMPEILVGLHFEAELGAYFETVYSWHCRTGPIHSRSGFRLLELYNFFKSWEMPWWNRAVACPEEACPKTVQFIRDNFSAEDQEFRLEQISRGLRFGRDKLIELTERYLFRAPLLFTVLLHKDDGPPFARALLSILYETMKADESGTQELIHDPMDEAWDVLKKDKSPEELLWVGIIEPQLQDVVHFWLQFRMNTEVLAPDLIKLCNCEGPSYELGDFKAPLLAVRFYYPPLFDCMHAAMGFISSNSRLVEQTHGMLRAKPVNNIGMDQADAKMSYLAGQEYEMRAERRKEGAKTLSKKTVAPKHDITKRQVAMIGEQMDTALKKFLPTAEDILSDPEHKIDSITVIMDKGRRVQDKAKAATVMESHKDKVSRQRRKQVTAAEVLTEGRAKEVSLANDNWLRGMTDEAMEAREKIAKLATTAHWETVPTPGKYKGGVLMSLAYKSMPLFELVVNVEGELKRMEVQARIKHHAKTLVWKKKKPFPPLFKITKKDALTLIRLHNNRLKTFASLIFDFAGFGAPDMPKHKTVPKEDFLQAFFKAESEEAFEHIDSTPAAVITALKSFCTIDTHYKPEDVSRMELEMDDDDDSESDDDGDIQLAGAYPASDLGLEEETD